MIRHDGRTHLALRAALTLLAAALGGFAVQALAAQNGVSFLMLALAIVAIMVFNSWMLVRFFGIDPATAIVGASPGAVEAMAALAIALGVNPALVAAHHILRIFLLMIGLPAAVTLTRRRWPHWQR